MKILAFDTSNSTASVAIAENDRILAYKEELRSSMQAESILPMIEDCFNYANLSYDDMDYLAVTTGPGSFTGIRIGLSVAKAILFATRIHAVAVSNFDISYFRATNQIKNFDKIVVCINAYRDQLYLQIFDKNGANSESLLLNYDVAIKLINSQNGNITCTGSGTKSIHTDLNSNITILPRFTKVKATYICKYLDHTIKNNHHITSTMEPLYIRPPDAKLSVGSR